MRIQPYTEISPLPRGRCTTWPLPLTYFIHLNSICKSPTCLTYTMKPSGCGKHNQSITFSRSHHKPRFWLDSQVSPICPMLDKLHISFGNLSTIVSLMTSASAKRKALETEGSAPDTPSPKRHHRDILPSPSAPDPTCKFIQVPDGCVWPDGLLVHEVVHGFALMTCLKGDQKTKFCTAFRGATWSKAKFAWHQAAWRSFCPREGEALRTSNHMWKDLYRKRQR